MPICLPADPRLANDTERKVWQLLCDQLGERDLLIAGQRVTDHLKDHEIDFVVAIEGAGIVCVEVKGGEVWHDGDKWWQQSRGGHVKEIEPVRQARDACYALRSFIEADPRWTQGRLRWDHIVVLPNSEVSEHFALPECPRWKVIDRDDLPTLAGRLRDLLLNQEIGRPLLSATGIEQLQIALSGREWEVIAFLVERAGKAVAKAQIADSLSEATGAATDNLIEVYVSRLRRRLAGSGAAMRMPPMMISGSRSVRGMGSCGEE